MSENRLTGDEAPPFERSTTPTGAGSLGTITRLLRDWRKGEESAKGRLFSRAYRELHRIARRQHRRYGEPSTLETTGLVHEAYLKLAARGGLLLRDRGHFYATAAKAMRQVLSNAARAHRAQKRGSGARDVTLDEQLPTVGTGLALSTEHVEHVRALEEALTRLERVSERQCRVVECRFYGGLSIPETAAVLGISEATVKRDWFVAQAWLYRALHDDRRES